MPCHNPMTLAASLVYLVQVIQSSPLKALFPGIWNHELVRLTPLPRAGCLWSKQPDELLFHIRRETVPMHDQMARRLPFFSLSLAPAAARLALMLVLSAYQVSRSIFPSCLSFK
jgi:hypothetical protein